MAGAIVRHVSDAQQQRTMNVREFVRGGYKEEGGPVIVVNGSGVAGVWFPATTALAVTPGTVTYARDGRGSTTNKPILSPIRPVPKPSARKR